MREITLEIARTLFEKKIPFCLYRFPNEKGLKIAVEGRFLPHSKKNDFWIAPFCKQSKAKDIHLSVISNSFLTETYLQKLQQFPSQKFVRKALPEATSKDDYLKEFTAYLNEINAGKIVKAVLSRVLKVEKPKTLNEINLFLKLETDYPETFTYLLIHPECGIWMGATPELLLRKRGKEIHIMALAGTQKRKSTGSYTWREKELEEHKMVGEHIEKVFKENNFQLQKRAAVRTIETGKVAHLQTDFIFNERASVDLKKLLEDVHPTPAVGGLPADTGLACVLKNENYDRQYYAGFLGETNFTTSSDLYINLRCMQIGENQIALFVGGGLTAASDIEEEWQETTLKSQTLISKITEPGERGTSNQSN